MNPTAAHPMYASVRDEQATVDERTTVRMLHGSYGRFAAMIARSTAIMFVLMYSLVYRPGHVWFADTRFLMALYMGAMMTMVMLTFMLGMYRNKALNGAVFGGATIVFVVARIQDPRVRELADSIIAAQNREIREMEALIRELEQR